METLERIQNLFLRAIYKIKKKDQITNKSLRTRANVTTIRSRLKTRATSYLSKAESNSNQLIIDLIESYKLSKENNTQATSSAQLRARNSTTLLSHYIILNNEIN